MFCRNCGKQIDDSAIVCPACGVPTVNTRPQGVPPQQGYGQQGYGQVPPQQGYQQPPVGNGQPYYPPQQIKRTNGFGIAGFVISLLSLWLGVYLCIAPIIALVFSILGTVKSKQFNSCNGLAIAGLVISIITLLIWGLVWLILGATLIASGIV